MAGTLLVSEPKYHDALRGMFAAGRLLPLTCCASAGEARRAMGSVQQDLAVINAPLADEFGRELAVQAAGKGIQVILLCPAAGADKVAAGLEKYGVLVLAKPITRQQVEFTLKLLRASCQQLAKLRQQNQRLLKQLEEARLISRAKCALVGYCGMTEEEAHHSIEKRAMDARVSRREIALNILKAYEDQP